MELDPGKIAQWLVLCERLETFVYLISIRDFNSSPVISNAKWRSWEPDGSMDAGLCSRYQSVDGFEHHSPRGSRALLRIGR